MSILKIDDNNLRVTEEVVIIQNKEELLINKIYIEEEIKKLQNQLVIINERIAMLK